MRERTSVLVFETYWGWNVMGAIALTLNFGLPENCPKILSESFRPKLQNLWFKITFCGSLTPKLKLWAPCWKFVGGGAKVVKRPGYGRNIPIYRVGHKNVALYFCPYLRQLLIDFHNSFTGTLCRQFAITWLLHIPPQRKCVSTLPCQILIKYAYITITNILVKLKKTLQTKIAVNGLYDTKLCGSNTV